MSAANKSGKDTVETRPASSPPGPAVKWARIALVAGALLLGMAVTLIVWDAATDDPPPAVITGRDG